MAVCRMQSHAEHLAKNDIEMSVSRMNDFECGKTKFSEKNSQSLAKLKEFPWVVRIYRGNNC